MYHWLSKVFPIGWSKIDLEWVEGSGQATIEVGRNSQFLVQDHPLYKQF